MFAIDKLTQTEKLHMMEALWRDLSANCAAVVPDWHGQALAQAEVAVASGAAQMVDWADAKNSLRRHSRS